MKKERKKQSLGTMIIIVGILLFGYWGNTSIEVTIYDVAHAKVQESFRGFTILQVSDLHNTSFGKNQKKLLEKIQREKPDLIVLTGDLVDSRRTNIPGALSFVEAARELAEVYYVSGNHEARIESYDVLEASLEDLGVIVLNNEVQEIRKGQDTLFIYGVQDPRFSEETLYLTEETIMEKQLFSMAKNEERFSLLLSHRPELFPNYIRAGMDLALTGHAHGGQIRLPFVGGLVAPNQGFFPRYSSGRYNEGDHHMIVSRGLGNSIFPLRIFNRPELVVVKLAPK